MQESHSLIQVFWTATHSWAHDLISSSLTTLYINWLLAICYKNTSLQTIVSVYLYWPKELYLFSLLISLQKIGIGHAINVALIPIEKSKSGRQEVK